MGSVAWFDRTEPTLSPLKETAWNAGDFTSTFSAQKATSNTRGSYTPVPPVPEPATGMILIGGGAGLAMFNRRRLRVAAREID